MKKYQTHKRFDCVIEHCINCPKVTADENITRWVCRPKNKMICWMGEGEDRHPIPDWCPLHSIIACTFCKSTDISTTSCGIEQYSVFCNGCGAEGPTGKDEEEAENLWIDRKE